jgi:hypothetical protein
MGLDMSIVGKKYSHDEKLNRSIKDLLGLSNTGDGFVEVKVELAYWRKANQIHAWFVDNVQNGNDDCGTYYVSREKLKELLDLCKEAIQTGNSDKLKPKEGFFFGSVDVNDWYWQNLHDTVDMLDWILSDKTLESWAFYYTSSW